MNLGHPQPPRVRAPVYCGCLAGTHGCDDSSTVMKSSERLPCAEATCFRVHKCRTPAPFFVQTRDECGTTSTSSSLWNVRTSTLQLLPDSSPVATPAVRSSDTIHSFHRGRNECNWDIALFASITAVVLFWSNRHWSLDAIVPFMPLHPVTHS